MTLRPADASAWLAVGAGSNGDNGGRSALWLRVARPSPAAYLRHLPGSLASSRATRTPGNAPCQGPCGRRPPDRQSYRSCCTMKYDLPVLVDLTVKHVMPVSDTRYTAVPSTVCSGEGPTRGELPRSAMDLTTLLVLTAEAHQLYSRARVGGPQRSSS